MENNEKETPDVSVFRKHWNEFKTVVKAVFKTPGWAAVALVIMILTAVLLKAIDLATDAVWQHGRIGVTKAVQLVAPENQSIPIYATPYLGSTQYASLAIFVCNGEGSLIDDMKEFADDTGKKNIFHKIEINYLKERWFDNEFLDNRAIVIFDPVDESAANPNKEGGWIHFLLAEMYKSKKFPPTLVFPNEGKETRWYLSVFVCR